jgi:hypothetical protein
LWGVVPAIITDTQGAHCSIPAWAPRLQLPPALLTVTHCKWGDPLGTQMILLFHSSLPTSLGGRLKSAPAWMEALIVHKSF